jgi:lambda repressor-like predicted transcriptional regulator
MSSKTTADRQGFHVDTPIVLHVSRSVDNLPEILQASAVPTDQIANSVGQNIRAEMGRQRVSMSELSRRTGRSRTTLSHQIDISAVTVDNLVLIARALGVSAANLLGDAAVEKSA